MTATSFDAKRNAYQSAILSALPYCLSATNFAQVPRVPGKVRDLYDYGDKIALVTTDRLSAFDRAVAIIPYKGQVLNLISAWWFNQTQHIVPNHMLSVPHPNILLAKKCNVFPVEFIVRGYITGSTNTSLWTQYAQGKRNYCGLHLPEGLQKNQRLKDPVITPTTKDAKHDRPLSPSEIIDLKLMTQAEWDEISAYALRLFTVGSSIAAQHDLILADTKYEFGIDEFGHLCLVDELHTPDSSRYWLRSTYSERFEHGLEPENIDKEFLRLWFTKQCDPYMTEVLPEAPQELIVTLAERYIQLYEMITGQTFNFVTRWEPPSLRINQCLATYIN